MEAYIFFEYDAIVYSRFSLLRNTLLIIPIVL